jgi:predicted permease
MRRDDDIQREIRTHIELEAEERAAEGLSETQARYAARRAFGSVARAQEDVRAVRSGAWLDDMQRDVAYALRALARHRGFAVVAILTLGLGIGASAAVFGLMDAVLLRPLPFAEPDRLVVVWEDFSGRGGPAMVEPAPGNFADWRDRARAFDGMAAIAGRITLNLTGAGDPERLTAARVTGSLFTLLGLRPVEGRTILPRDDQPGATPVAVISEGLWRRRFGSDRAVVGQTIALDDVPHTVVGIVPGDFQFPVKDTEVWVPASFTPELLASRSIWFLYVVARLGPGVSLVQAQAEMDRIAARLREEHPATNERLGVTLVPLHEQYVRTARPMFILLAGTAALLMLIASVNVAHLLLARGADRRREIAVRGALGAGRARLVRQLLTEAAVLAGVGALVGLALASLASGLFIRLVPENFPDATGVGVSGAVAAFAAGLALLTSFAFATGPALAASRLRLHDALKGWGARGFTRRERALRGSLVVTEVALTVVLLIAAALLLRSYATLSRVEMGFPRGGLLVAETPLAPARYGDSARRVQFVAAVLERIERTPGVVSAGYVNYLPLTFPGGRIGFLIEGRQLPPAVTGFAAGGPAQSQGAREPRQLAVNRAISPEYLATLGVPLLQGRHFDARDRVGAPMTAIINRTMAETFWAGEDPVGRRIFLGPPGAPPIEIVGVVGDVRQIGLDRAPEPELYVPIAQMPDQAAPFVWPRHLVVRTSGDPAGAARAVREAVRAVDAGQPVANLRTMEDLIDAQLTGRSTQLTLIGTIALLALGLAAVGLYGVLAHAVARQAPEIGLRMALGATRSVVVGALLRRTFVLTGTGLAIGLASAALASRALSSLLYEVSPADPAAFAAVPVLLMLVAAAASWLPARRATRVDPLVALRAE